MFRTGLFWAGAFLAVTAAACRTRPSECIPLASPEATRRTEITHSSLPRFQRTWQREGFGSITGVAEGNVYYTLSNDRRTVAAIDVTNGKSIWETTLPEPARIRVELEIGQGVLTLMHRAPGLPGEHPSDAAILRLEASHGQLLWSKLVACPDASLLRAAPRLFLHCGSELTSRNKSEVIEFDAKGDEIGRVEIAGRLQALPGGKLCGFRNEEMWCGTIDGGRLSVAWSHPGPTRSHDIRLAGDTVMATGENEIIARAAKSGEVLWRRPGRHWIVRGDTSARVLLVEESGATFVRAANGATLARFDGSRGGHAIRGHGELLVIDPGGAMPVRLVDGASAVRELAGNVERIDHVIGDVMLAHSKGVARSGDSGELLEAFSLVSFAPALDQLGGYDRTIAILQIFPRLWEAKSSLAELRRAPDWQESLERVIDEGPEHLRSVAIEAAGQSGEPRFLPVLTRYLNRLVNVSPDEKTWSDYYTLLRATSRLNTPDAAAALLTFWQAARPALAKTPFETSAREAVGTALWRYSNQKEWVTCGDTTFPIAPEEGSLGTSSPSLAYALDRDRRWAAICEARRDDDSDGQLQVVTLYHGDTGGDHLRPYLVLGSGPGTEIDDFINADPTGRWVVVTKDFCVNLVDTRSGKGVALRGADGREGGAVIGTHRAANFSPDGRSLLYIRSDGDRSVVVIRDLETASERLVDPGPGVLASAAFDGTGRRILMDVVQSDTNGDGRVEPPEVTTIIAARRCRGLIVSASFHGTYGDRPVRRFASLASGDVKDAGVSQCFERPENVPLPYKLEPRIPPGEERAEVLWPNRPGGRMWPKLPLGPLWWKKSDR